ncbi:hypothetical protein CCUS01_11354 [Colletotrichum cuscutae]|uniref:Heterokaryon incompatibility domain-containing protein n=1 Tax=Colletotrichum cuscutae TaxID=1209917 RepID=A0AAI9U7P2_9PEZI|nr:hypothetical protein CCUS01_11354 [Colletotrichum cuscutae]
MQNIYATASRVLIYLGEDKEDLNATSSSPWNFDKWNTYYERSLPAHKDLTQQPYFKRVWVIQEIAAAQDCWVLYGTRGDRWQDFLQRKDVKYCDRNIDWLHMLPKGNLMDSEELPSLLLATALCKATDPRDKLFALLGLLQDAKQAQLNADYSLSEEQVFSGLTAYLLSKSTTFLLPVFAALQPTSSSPCPSWAVDWSSATNLDCMGPYLADNDSRPTTESDTGRVSFIPRFHQNGLLALRGRLIVTLSSCIFEPECQQGPPGVLGKVYYGRGTRIPGITPSWAEPTDEICQIQGLDGHALVPRPVPKAPKTYRFVAICKQPVFHRLSACLNSIDRTAILLFSTWRYILRTVEPLRFWFLAGTWNKVEEICRSIKHFWNLEKAICRFLDGNRDPRCGKSPACEEEVQAASHKLGNTNPRGMWPQQQDVTYQQLSNKAFYDSSVNRLYLEQTSKIGKFGKSTAGEKSQFGFLAMDLSLSVKAFRRFPGLFKLNNRWKTLGDLDGRFILDKDTPRGLLTFITDLGWEFGSSTGIPTAEKLALTRRDPENHQHKFPWQFDNLEMDAFEALVKNIRGSRADYRRLTSRPMLPNSFTATLLNQDLEMKLAFFDQSTLVFRDRNAGTTFSRDRVLPWLQDALNLESRPLPTGGSYRNAHLDTWAADFIRTWTLLMKDIRPKRLPPIRPEDLPPQETEERLLREQGYLAAAEAKWAPLLDLVKFTEARLLPMKETFIRAEDTHDESMDGVPWEDIFIA